ncbi:hypothetical protein SDC9_51331 [bioreactor metagenome]|uniref:Uncharacterized protein n=1 Tax=bioreactor metagenome TaxID=1076179 RepID=A0A644WN46_9ZZZZ
MKKASTKTTAKAASKKAPAKKTAEKKATAKPTTARKAQAKIAAEKKAPAKKTTIKKAPVKKVAVKKSPAEKVVAKKAPANNTGVKKAVPVQAAIQDKLNKLERAFAENKISRAEYEMWRDVYSKEVPFNENVIKEEDYRPRKIRRRAY